MAIDPTVITTQNVGSLPTAPINLTNIIPHEVDGNLKQSTINDLAVFIAAYVGASSALVFNNTKVTTGQTLPATTKKEFLFIGAGTFSNVGGGAAITTTQGLNVLTSNGSFWTLSVEVPVTVTFNGLVQTIRQGFTGTVTSEGALFDALELIKADVIKSAPFLGSITPTSTPTGTGVAYWLATQNGTYTNFGGVVVAANSFAIISRSAAGAFSISQTALDISSKVNVSDVVNNLDSISSVKPLSGLQGKIINESKAGLVIGKNLINKNAVTDGFSISVTNVITGNVDRFYTEYIKVNASTAYYMSPIFVTVNYYDSNFVWLSAGATYVSAFTTPVNTAYVRLTILLTNKNTAQLEVGNAATTYENHIKSISPSQIKLTDIIDNSVSSANTTKGVTGNAITTYTDTQIQSNLSGLLPFIDFGTITNDLKSKLIKFFISAKIQIPSTYVKENITCKIIFVLKNSNISGTIYKSVNVSIYNSGTLIATNIISSKSTDGIQEFTGTTAAGFILTFKVNWDSLPDGSLAIDDAWNVKLTNSAKVITTGILYDQAYIKNGELICNNDNINTANTVAKYMQVKLDSVGKKILFKFKTKGGLATVIFTKLQTRNYIQNIVNDSIHVVFDTNAVTAYKFINQVSVGTVAVNYAAALDTTGNTEYEAGFEVKDQNTLTLYLPNGTTTDVTIANVKDSSGVYALFEFYTSGLTATPIPTSDYARPTFTGFFAIGESATAVAMQDNFRRQDGVLTVAPSGHVYTLFKNSYTGITKYEPSNGNYTL